MHNNMVIRINTILMTTVTSINVIGLITSVIIVASCGVCGCTLGFFRVREIQTDRLCKAAPTTATVPKPRLQSLSFLPHMQPT